MLIVDARDSDSIDKALKKYKKKFELAGVLRELRNRQAYTKKSVARRNQVLKAAYRENVVASMEK
jgi:small subunit ribosomal protein S21